MARAGITRIVITDSTGGTGAWRFAHAKVLQPFAQKLYRQIFEKMDCQLLPGEAVLNVSKDEHLAGYDHLLGIDVLLHMACGMQSTLQEKFLFYSGKEGTTVTVEYQQNPRTGEEGDWFNLKAHYYFVGYNRLPKLPTNGLPLPIIQDWILLNWPATQLATCGGRITWKTKFNTQDNARANFRFVKFDHIPVECIVARGRGMTIEMFSQSIMF